jgi:hypothetical protein
LPAWSPCVSFEGRKKVLKVLVKMMEWVVEELAGWQGGHTVSGQVPEEVILLVLGGQLASAMMCWHVWFECDAPVIGLQEY